MAVAVRRRHSSRRGRHSPVLAGGTACPRRAEARRSALAVHGMQLRSRVGQAILPAAAFQAALRTSTEQPSQTKGFIWPRVLQGSAAKPEKFVRRRGSRLKAGCSQDWLPHERAKAERRAEARRRLKPAPHGLGQLHATNGQSRVAGGTACPAKSVAGFSPPIRCCCARAGVSPPIHQAPLLELRT
jgi:hypothetical protein